MQKLQWTFMQLIAMWPCTAPQIIFAICMAPKALRAESSVRFGKPQICAYFPTPGEAHEW
jgi:hypothetical protein